MLFLVACFICEQGLVAFCGDTPLRAGFGRVFHAVPTPSLCFAKMEVGGMHSMAAFNTLILDARDIHSVPATQACAQLIRANAQCGPGLVEFDLV